MSTDPTPSLRDLRDRAHQLEGFRRKTRQQYDATEAELARIKEQLDIAEGVSQALDTLSRQIFGDVVSLLESKLSIALQEVLDQPISLRVDCRYLRGSAAIEFSVDRNGMQEHILKGQGGSVANVLSVGLRMFALTTLDPDKHRRFLILDEQDCWLRPDLVPRFVKIVHDAGVALGFQILLISHHDSGAFEHYADRIIRFEPTRSGVKVKTWDPADADEHNHTPHVEGGDQDG